MFEITIQSGLRNASWRKYVTTSFYLPEHFTTFFKTNKIESLALPNSKVSLEQFMRPLYFILGDENSAPLYTQDIHFKRTGGVGMSLLCGDIFVGEMNCTGYRHGYGRHFQSKWETYMYNGARYKMFHIYESLWENNKRIEVMTTLRKCFIVNAL